MFSKSKFLTKIVILAGLEVILGPLGTILGPPGTLLAIPGGRPGGAHRFKEGAGSAQSERFGIPPLPKAIS